jgi:drug/metabolite transporter (DMT)-like permease
LIAKAAVSLEALVLVLIGATCHAAWNILAKRCAGGLMFVWQFGLVSLVPAVPLGLWYWQHHPATITAAMVAAIAASALVHVIYAVVLQQGYRASEFSVVYPVARGSGPVLTVVAAVLLWGEHPSLVGWFGVIAVLGGIFFVAGSARLLSMLKATELQMGLVWGLATGGLVATYTLIDAWAVRSLGMAPMIFYPLSLVLRSAVLTPLVVTRTAEARSQWQASRGAIIGVGVLSPAAYLLALLALELAPLSYVAPVREISMLVGALVGARLLGEALNGSRIVGVVLLLAGVVGIAVA